MGGIIQECHRRFKLAGINGVLIKYSKTGCVTSFDKLVNDSNLSDRYLYEVLFVDDWEFFAQNVLDMQNMMDIINEVVQAFGQQIAIEKAKYMKIGNQPDPDDKKGLWVEGKQIEQVTQFKYLGVIEAPGNNMDFQFNAILQKMQMAYKNYKVQIIDNKYLTLRTKLNLYHQLVLTPVLYGSATWRLTKKQMTKLETRNFRYLKYIVPGVSRMSTFDEVIINAAESGCVIFTIEGLVLMRPLRFLGHVERMGVDTIQRIMIHGRFHAGKQLVGAPKIGYRAVIRYALNSFGINDKNWMQIAQDRVAWRKLIDKSGYCHHTSLMQKRNVGNNATNIFYHITSKKFIPSCFDSELRYIR